MTALDTSMTSGSLLASLLSEDTFQPAEPNSIEETGVTSTVIEGLICKYIMMVGSASGRQIAEQICLPFRILESVFQSLRQRQVIVHSASAQLNDYYYQLTDQGRDRTRAMMDSCAYAGPAPVPLVDYVMSVDAQTIRAESPKRYQLEKAFSDISVETELFDLLGPAINSGAGLFLYGAPGNGKTTLGRPNHDLFRPRHLGPANPDRGRPVYQAVRCGVPRCRGIGRRQFAEELQS